MGINKLSCLKDYWSTDKCVRNKKIQNVIIRTWFQSILQNLHFSNNDNKHKTDKLYKICPVIEHLNKVVYAESLLNSPFQSLYEHMFKFKGRSSMKQYVKDKTTKWGFKYLYRSDSETGYVYQLELYQRRKRKRELILGSSVVLDLCQVLRDTYCHVFFNNFFNSPKLIQKLHNNALYGRFGRINMSQMKKDKEMKQGDYQCKFCNHTGCIKWYDNKSMMLLRSHLEEITSILTVQRRLKGSSSKIPVNCPNAIKLYNNKMGGVDWSEYQLDLRSKLRFYLRFVFDLFDVAIVNSFIVYKKPENKDLTLKKFKLCISLKLITSFVSRKLAKHRLSKYTEAQRLGPIPTSHLPIFFETRRRRTVYSLVGTEKRTFFTCSLYYVAFCLQKEINCFLQ